MLRRSADLTRREDWPGQHACLRDRLESLLRAFGPRIKRLDDGDLAPEPTPPGL